MKPLVHRFAPWALFLTLLPVSGFGGHHPAPPDPKFLAIHEIVILPVVDERAGQKDKVDLNKNLVQTAQRVLLRKHYAVKLSSTTGPVGQIVEEDLTGAKPEWIKRLGPPEARWVMVVGVSDAHSKITFGSTGNAEVFGSLYDKETGSVIWGGKGTGRVGQGGLLGMAMKGAMSAGAVQAATVNLLSDLPKLPKKR